MKKQKQSLYFSVQGSGNRSYDVTINHQSGHWCTCKGMISMKRKHGERAGTSYATSCKHVKGVLDREPSAQDTDAKFSNAPDPAPPMPTGRRAAVMATRAKRENEILPEEPSRTSSLLDRIAALEAARSG